MEYDPSISVRECQHVYPPSEDTFLMLRALEVGEGERVLEMGCGAGLLSLHCAKGGARVTAADVNPHAVECVRGNAAENRLEVEAVESDLFDRLRGRYDLIIFNPPYLPVEEAGLLERAWAGGPDGLSPLDRFLEGCVDQLSPGGRVLVLLSSKMDQERLRRLLSPFQARELCRGSFFFERLWVLELRPPHHGRDAGHRAQHQTYEEPPSDDDGEQ